MRSLFWMSYGIIILLFDWVLLLTLLLDSLLGLVTVLLLLSLIIGLVEAFGVYRDRRQRRIF
jgi:hypothetical protein